MSIAKKEAVITPTMTMTGLKRSRPMKQIAVPTIRKSANIPHLLMLNHYQIAFCFPKLQAESVVKEAKTMNELPSPNSVYLMLKVALPKSPPPEHKLHQ